METPNIFDYATSELSQDAFLCYLCAFGKEEYKNDFPNEYKIAHKFLTLCGIPENEKIEDIKRQHKHIDILITTTNHFLIIEDKTGTNEHGDQIARYYDSLCKEYKDIKGISEKVRVCYFKTDDYICPYKPSKNLELDNKLDITQCCSLKCQDLFDIIKNSNNPVIKMFCDKQRNIKAETEKCDNNDISTWTRAKWFDVLYNALKNNNKITDRVNIENVPKGGFYGCWFDFRKIGELTLYKQIEIHINKDENKTVSAKLCLRCSSDSKDITKNNKECINSYSNTAKGYNKPKKIRTGQTTAFAYKEAKTKDDVLNFINDDILTKL